MTDELAGQKVCYLEEAEVQIVAKKSTTYGKWKRKEKIRFHQRYFQRKKSKVDSTPFSISILS